MIESCSSLGDREMDAGVLAAGLAKRMKAENGELQMRNNSLELENQNLKRQLLELSSISSKMQKIAEEKMEVTRTASALESENKELKEKLEIMVQKNAGLSEQIEKVKGDSERTQSTVHKNLQAQLNQLKLENGKLESQKARLENELNTAIEERDRRIEKLENEMASLFKAASRKFKVDVVDFDSMLMFLAQKETKGAVEEGKADGESSELEEMVRELKKANKKLKMQVQECQDEAKRQMSSAKREHVKDGEEVRAKLFLAQQNGERQAQRITELLQENSDMKITNSKLLAQIELFKARPEPMPAKVQVGDHKMAEKREELKEKNRVLKQQVATLVARTGSLEQAKVVLKTKLKSYEVEVNEMKTELAFVRQEKTEADAKNIRMAEEIDNLKQKVDAQAREAKQLGTVISQHKREIDQRKISFEQCEHVIAQQTSEIRTLQAERNQAAALLHTCLRLQARMEQEMVKFRQAEERSCQERLCQKKEDIMIPVKDFCYEMLPEDISCKVKEIALNQSLKPRARVKQVITLLYQYYVEQISDLDDKIKEVQFAYKQKISDFNRFFDSLRRVLPGYNIELTDGACPLEIADVIKKLQTDNQRLIQESAEKDRNLTAILAALDVDCVNEVEQLVDGWKMVIKKLRKRTQAERNEMKEMKRQYKLGLLKLQQHITELERDLQAKQDHITQRDLENGELRTRLAEAVKAAQEAMLTYNQQIFQAKLAELQEKMEEQIRSEVEKRHVAEAKCKNRKKELDKVQEKYNTLVTQNQQRMLEIRELKAQQQALIKSNRDKLHSQQDALFEKYESTVQVLRAKNSQFKTEVVNLNETVSKLENTKNSLETQNRDLSHQLRRCQLQFESQNAELERERQIILSRAKAEGLNREVGLQETIQKLQYEVDAAKKDLMTLVGRQFCSLFDVSEKFTEETFDAFLKKIRSEFERLTRTERNIRQLLALGPNQSIEDALSSLLLKK